MSRGPPHAHSKAVGMPHVTRFITLSHAEQLDIENEIGLRWDRRRVSASPVPLLPRDRELPLAADLHADDPFLPSLDEPGEGELDGLAALVAGVELGAVHERAAVVHLDGLLDGGALGSSAD